MIILIDKRTGLESRRVEPFKVTYIEPWETLGGSDAIIKPVKHDLANLLGIKYGFCSSCKRDNATFEST